MTMEDFQLELESFRDSLRIFKGTILNNPNLSNDSKRATFEELEEHLREILEKTYE